MEVDTVTEKRTPPRLRLGHFLEIVMKKMVLALAFLLSSVGKASAVLCLTQGPKEPNGLCAGSSDTCWCMTIRNDCYSSIWFYYNHYRTDRGTREKRTLLHAGEEDKLCTTANGLEDFIFTGEIKLSRRQ